MPYGFRGMTDVGSEVLSSCLRRLAACGGSGCG